MIKSLLKNTFFICAIVFQSSLIQADKTESYQNFFKDKFKETWDGSMAQTVCNDPRVKYCLIPFIGPVIISSLVNMAFSAAGRSDHGPLASLLASTATGIGIVYNTEGTEEQKSRAAVAATLGVSITGAILYKSSLQSSPTTSATSTPSSLPATNTTSAAISTKKREKFYDAKGNRIVANRSEISLFGGKSFYVSDTEFIQVFLLNPTKRRIYHHHHQHHHHHHQHHLHHHQHHLHHHQHHLDHHHQ